MSENNTASQPLFLHDSITPQYESHLTTFNNDDGLPLNFDNSSSSSFLTNQNEEENILLIGSPGSGTINNNDFDEDLGPTFIDNNPQAINKPQQASVDEMVHLKLMNLCHDVHVPQHAYNKILKWAQDSKMSGYTFSTNAPSQTLFLKELYQRFNMQNIQPKIIASELYPNKVAEIVTFPFTEMFKSLLFDVTLSSPKILLSHSVSANNNDLSDINTGSWYRKPKQCYAKTTMIIFVQ